MGRFTGLIGLSMMVAAAYFFSTNRRAIRWKTVAWGLGLQVIFALVVFRLGLGQVALKKAGGAVYTLLSFSFAGSSFVFGPLGAQKPSIGFFFAFMVLPTIIFISAFFAILYHFGIMQFIIKIAARVMMSLMGISGAESLDVAASIFMGQTEAPLTIRPYLPDCTTSELMTIMTAGMAHVSGGIMGAYILFGIRAEHLLSAVIMTAPGTIVMAKMLVPETEQPRTAGKVELADDEAHKDENLLGAIARGTMDGGQLAFNVAIMLIAFLALVALLNGMMGGIHNLNHMAWFPQSMETVLGALFAPVAWIIGVPAQDCIAIGNLLGTRMVINELVAYSLLGAQQASLLAKSYTIATFALCGFANFASIGIQIGGIGALAPNRRNELARLGFRAMLAGTMANLMSASIVSLLI